jgi:HSP20 family protein
MKTQPITRLIPSTILAVCMAGLALPGPASLQAGQPNNPAADAAAVADKKGFLEKMNQWQDKMSEKFRDTWKSLRSASKEKSIASASVDLREGPDNYTVRLNLPDRDLDKVDIKLEGTSLRIVAPASDKTGRYEQSVVLAAAAPLAEPKIERKQQDSLIVVTVPKRSAVLGITPPLALPDPSLLPPLSAWEADVFAHMERMRRDMDRTFDDAFREFRAFPEHKGFFDEPRFGSSLDLKEEGDNYVVRAYLPGRDMQNIDVTVKDGALRIEAKEQAMTKKEGETGTLHSSRHAAYSQFLTLPGPVQSEKMKVEKKEGMLVVTLPKAK